MSYLKEHPNISQKSLFVKDFVSSGALFLSPTFYSSPLTPSEFIILILLIIFRPIFLFT